MAEIENLSISISANAAEAIAEINKLASALGKFNGASNSAGNSAGRTADKVQDLGTATAQEAEETGEAAAATKTFGDRLKAVGINVDAIKDRFKSLTGNVGSFFSMIKRVATYRAIRAALRMITDGFKEGIKNFYDYSKAIDGKFAKSMDSLSSSVLYLRNSLGTLAAPVIEALAPVFNTIVNVIVDAINAFNMFIAAVSGSSTYTAAVRVSSEWGNAAEQMANDVDNIESTAKRIKSTILGFDEINPLKAENTGGGGGGGGYGGGSGGGGGAGIMFEERPLEGFLQTIADITSGLPDWLKWLLGGTALVGGFALIKSFIPWLISKLGELFSMRIPDWFKWLLGNRGEGGSGTEDTRDVTIDLQRGDWGALDELNDKTVNATVNVNRGTWDNDAWAAATMTSYSPTRTVTAVVQKGEWDNDAWNAANMTSYSPTRAVNSTVKKGDWNNDAWLAANMTSYSATRNVTSNVTQGDWDSTAWLAASMTSNSARRNIAVNVEKGTWDDTAWTAANMTSFSPVRTITAKVAKGAWNDTAWLAANMAAYNATRTVTGKVVKGDWDNTAWAAANMTSFNPIRTVTVKVVKDAWDNTAWLAANMTSYDSIRTVVVNTKKGDSWDNTAVDIGLSESETINRSVEIKASPKIETDEDRFMWQTFLKDPFYLDRKIIEFFVSLTQDGWTTVEDYVDGHFTSGGDHGGGGHTSGGGVGRNRHYEVAITPTWGNTNYSNISSWLSGEYMGKDLNKPIGAVKGGVLDTYGTVRQWILKTCFGKDLNKPIGTTRGGALKTYGNVGNWIISKWFGGDVNKPVSTERGGNLKQYGTVAGWLYGKWFGGDVTTPVGLKKGWGNKDPLEYLNVDNLSTDIQVGFVTKPGATTVQVTGGGSGTWALQTRAMGGIFSNGIWSAISQFANGGIFGNHGSLFLAGEAGPEIVGHVGGRTEVLNQSQLAATMYAAVRNAMTGITIDTTYSGSVNAASGEDMGMLAEMVRMGVEQAMARQNELDRQRNEYLRQINEKEFSADVSTSAINRANSRMNRRAGITVAPVGAM